MQTDRSFRPELAIAVLIAVAAAILPVNAVAQQAQSHSVIVIDPASSHLRKALNALSPTLAAAARWQTADEKDDGELTAHSVTIDLPWRQSRLTAETLTITADQLRLQGVRLENGRGVFEAGEIRGPKRTWNALAAFAATGTDAAGAPTPGGAGALHISDFRLSAKPRQRGDRRFSSSWQGRTLEIGGLHCATKSVPSGACDFLGIDALAAKGLSAETAFSGEARLKADAITFSMSGAGQGAWRDPSAIAAAFTRRPDEAGKAIGVELTIRNLHLTASRVSASDAPSTVEVKNAHLALDRQDSGGFKLDGTLDSHLSANVLKGTQFWPAITEQASVSSGSDSDLLPLTAGVSASYDAGAFTLSRLTANAANLLTLQSSAHVSGLTSLFDQSGEEQVSSGLSKLMGVAVSSFSLIMHDQGMTKLVEAAFGASPAVLVREAAGVPASGTQSDGTKSGDATSSSLMSLMMGGGNVKAGLKTIVRTATVERVATLLDQLAESGSIELKCQSTPACIALAIGSQN